MHKTSFIVTTVINLVFAALIAKVAHMIKSQVPVGYEDEAGFHYGSK